jgi:hypothetical protein
VITKLSKIANVILVIVTPILLPAWPIRPGHSLRLLEILFTRLLGARPFALAFLSRSAICPASARGDGSLWKPPAGG